MMKNQFSKNEIKAIEGRYEDNIIYKAFRGPCLHLGQRAKTFFLSPCELFYHCMFTIDSIIGYTDLEARSYCDCLWEDLQLYFNDKLDGAEDADICLAVSSIIQGVVEILVRGENVKYSTAVGLLKRSIEKHDNKINTILDKEFRKGFGYVESRKLKDFITDYFVGSVSISSDIDELLDTVDGDTMSGAEPLAKSPIRIADGKKEYVIAVLEAMFYNGYFKLESGNINRDMAIKNIMKYGLGTEAKAISQAINKFNIKHSLNEIFSDLENTMDSRHKNK